ncbi:MAG: hypothetical protein CL674_08410 [Bdellovibrionaceae bacterium]|nr:hypothetical protein [Pseudobdellovibrionaceae bacterium]|tara:strand:+ start:3812 stop:5545 length:1734 start_codon:yes stop_codon:yes gene_type:complete
MDQDILFEDLGLSKSLLKAVANLGFETPSEIQQKSIPVLIENECDFVGQAQTGTGKTAAFGLPLLMKLKEQSDKPQALVLAPTRELALQISTEFGKFSKYENYNKVEVCGGMNYRPQLQALRSGDIQLVIGTPGRVIDLLDRGALDLSELQYLVLDEADEMLNMGFFEDVQRIIEGANPNRNLWMFSATMPKQIKGLIEKSFRNPVFVNTKSKEVSNADIEQSYYLVKDKYKLNALTQVLDMIDNFYGVIFCQTRQETKDLGYTLMDQNYNVSVLHGDLSQAERSSAMRDFKKGKTKVLICTDVAARGIDVNNLTHVINFGLPRDKESYVHRIGRTGRAGNKGFAISILNREDIHRLKRIESLQKASIKREKFPEIRERKKIFIEKKTKKFDSLAYQLMQEQENYTVDEVFEQFNQRFDSFSKEDTLKMIFNSLFKNDLRRMDELSDIELDVADENRRSSRSTRGRDGGGRGRDRDRRRSRGRSRDGARDRDGGRERDRDSRPSRSRSERGAKSSDRSERRERGERKDSASFSSSKPKGDSRKSSKPKAKSGQKGSSFFTPGQKKKRKANESRSRSR